MGFEKVILGRSGLSVSRLGIGSGYGTNAAMVEEAVDRGVNYLYWGALKTKKMAEGIRNVIKTKREEMVIVVPIRTSLPFRLPKLVQKNLKILETEYLDVLLLPWYNKAPSQSLIEQLLKLKEVGLIKVVALSGHNRVLFPQLEKDKKIDIYHIRYNAVHRGAEREIFPKFSDSDDPGIVTFTTTRWTGLLNPKNLPPGEDPIEPADCYRFVLSHPRVHVAIFGPNSSEQLREDLKAIDKGPMSEEELASMRKIGDYIYKNASSTRDHIRSLRSIKWRNKKGISEGN